MDDQDRASRPVDQITAQPKETSLGAPEGPPAHSAANGSASRATKGQGSSFVEVRSAGALGQGVFAVQDIARGTRIISEAPLLVVQPASAPNVLKEHIAAFCAAVRALPAEGLETLDGLCCNQNMLDKEQAQQIIHGWHEQHGDEMGRRLNTRKLRRADNRALARFSIFLANRVGMGRDSAHGDGLFPLFSRINHSCSPNVTNSYNPTIERLTVHATRDIKAGDQVFTEYTNGAFRKRFWRQAALERYGFRCQCKSCTNPEEEALRDHMIDLDMAFFVHENHAGLLGPGTTGPEEVSRTLKRALEANEAISALLRHPVIDLQSIQLCRMWVDITLASPPPHSGRELDDIKKAKDYARRELDVEEAVIGTETDHLSEDLVGAKYWLEYLETLV